MSTIQVEQINHFNTEIEEIFGKDKEYLLENENKLKLFVKDLIYLKLNNINEIDSNIKLLRKKYKIYPPKSNIRYIYEKYYSNIPIKPLLQRFMIKKAMRSRSGVLVSTIVLKPDKFSCPKKCSYCPTETDLNGNPTQPKSYLSTEPAMLRALQYDFDIKGQLHDRIKSYIKTGNINNFNSNKSHKLEIIISGGTWESYKYEYRNQVIHELYFAANTFGILPENQRDMFSLEEEITMNESSTYRIIGLTLETRPDFITNQSIRDYRRWGVTRMQIGVQHYDDGILNKINRECYTKDTIRAIKLLKQCGFKVVCHLMPDLPGSSPILDKWMFDCSINDPDLQFDDVKIYPTAICKSEDPNLLVTSDIASWYEKGEYIPYAEKDIRTLINVLKYYKRKIQPWIRIQRLVRDIPPTSIEAGYDKLSNLRQVIKDEMNKDGESCKCIRCMEIGDNLHLLKNTRLVVRKYRASQGDEYYISIESNDKTRFCINLNNLNLNYIKYLWFLVKSKLIYLFTFNTIYWDGDLSSYNGLIGFCRLRLDNNSGAGIIKEIENAALIREVHVYGYSLGVNVNIDSYCDTNDNHYKNSSQHKGYGKILVQTAENIALENGYSKIAVISGVGTREYYKNKCGYELEGTYMTKYMDLETFKKDRKYIKIFWILILVQIYLQFMKYY
jgi:ELP3 family radical SAM enzyme/protein acetyltransferase